MLKAFVLGVAFLLSFSAGAEPLDLTGRWAVSGEILPSFRVETIIQRDWTEAEKAKLAELRSQGYACVFVYKSTYKCRKSFFDHWEPSEKHRVKLVGEFQGKGFEIVKTPGEPEVITSGDSVTQWQLPVLIYSSNGKTDNVIYWELSDMAKLHFELAGEEFWPHFTSSDRMNFRTYVMESGKDCQTQFYYDVVFIQE